MNYFIIIFLVLICVCYFRLNKKKSEKFTNERAHELNYVRRPIIPSKTKKSSRPRSRRIFGRPNKCFSYEREIMRKTGGKNIHLAFPTKCFDCEKQSKNPYMTGPTKCFSCD